MCSRTHLSVGGVMIGGGDDRGGNDDGHGNGDGCGNGDGDGPLGMMMVVVMV